MQFFGTCATVCGSALVWILAAISWGILSKLLTSLYLTHLISKMGVLSTMAYYHEDSMSWHIPRL